jgi:peptidoglycan/LPS O-acetylase OafA/YrhL
VTYFTAPQFYSYMLNIIGWPHYLLPGVFENNLSPKVNGALWTIPWEIFCYIIMSCLMVTAAIRRPTSTAAVLVVYFATGLIVEHFVAENPIAYFLFVSRGSQLIAAFLCGILAYQLKDRLPYSFAFWPRSSSLHSRRFRAGYT